MIYGCFFFQSDFEAKIQQFEEILQWPTASFERIEYKQFSGGIVLDQSWPRSKSNYYHLDKNTQTLLLFSGTIYSDLEQNNTFKPENTAETLLKCFYSRGNNFVKNLNGDFCIAIYQAKAERVLLFRDQLGIEPLAYAVQKEDFYFSSDILNLCKFLHEPTSEIELEALLGGVKLVNYRATPNQKIHKLLPAHRLYYQNQQVNLQKYWFPEHVKISKKITFETAKTELLALMQTAVQWRLDLGLKTATHLSGGLDSSYVSALVKLMQDPTTNCYGYSWSPKELDDNDLEFDERKIVEQLALHLGIEPVFVDAQANDLDLMNSRYFANSGSYEEEYVLQHAQENGIQTLFSGWGGDQFVSMRNSGIESDLFFSLKWKKIWKNKWRIKKNLAHWGSTIILPALGILRKRLRQELEQETIYLNANYKQQDSENRAAEYTYRSRRDRQLKLLDSFRFAQRTDNTHPIGQRFGVAYRYPLLDIRIVEFMLSLPSSVIYHPERERNLFRESIKELLPASICERSRKTDPALNAFSESYYRHCAEHLMKNFMQYKLNPDLKCFNFDAIERDFKLLQQGNESNMDKHILYCSIFNCEMIDRFIKHYNNTNYDA